MDKWLTIPQTMALLNVSRPYVYTLASRYDWRTQKVGATRLYHEADVKATPDADKRQRAGYEKRQTSAHGASSITRVEKGD